MTNFDDWEMHWENLHSVTNYEPARKWRRDSIINLLSLQGRERILDLGAGKGDLIRDLKRISSGFIFGATEYSAAGLRMIRSENGELISEKVNLEVGIDSTQKDLLMSGGNWDIVVCSEVLEHLNDTSLALSTIRELSNPNTQIVITVPSGPIAAVDRAFGHRRHYTRLELREMLEMGGFEIQQLKCLGFPFFNLYRLGLLIRGKHILRSIQKISQAKPGIFSKMLLNFFSWLFRFNCRKGNFGWQLIAVCRKN